MRGRKETGFHVSKNQGGEDGTNGKSTFLMCRVGWHGLVIAVLGRLGQWKLGVCLLTSLAYMVSVTQTPPSKKRWTAPEK